MVSAAATGLVARGARALEIARFAADAYVQTWALDDDDDDDNGDGGGSDRQPGAAAAAAEVGAWFADRCTSMGPWFVKLGQLFSTRSDVLPVEIVDALASLHDAVEYGDDVIVRPAVRGFTVTSIAPINSGSVASVWPATADADGRRVVIKQLHRGVRASFEQDLPIIIGVLRLAMVLRVPGAANFYEIVTESLPRLFDETRLDKEALNMIAFSSAAPAGVRVPAVFGYGSEYIVQEFVRSTKVTTCVSGRPCPALARQLMIVLVRSVLDVGLVHADGHPGNIGVLPDGSIVLYDWGACVDVSHIRRELATLFDALASGNLDLFVECLQSLGVIETTSASDAYRVVRVLRKLAKTPADEFHVGLSRQPEFADSAGNRLVRFNADVVYLIRAVSLVEGVCRSLDPYFSYPSYWDMDVREIVKGFMDERNRERDSERNPGVVVAGWLTAAAGMPDTQRRTLDATYEMTATLREEMAETRRAVSVTTSTSAAVSAVSAAVAATLAVVAATSGGGHIHFF